MEIKSKNISLKAILIVIGLGIWVMVLQNAGVIPTKQTPYNSTYPKVAVQWLNLALCFYQSFCLVDSEVLLNRQLRVAANR
jgi:hypothetical protein